MKEFYKPILDKLYEVRSTEFSNEFGKIHQKQLRKNKTSEKEELLTNAIDENISNEQIKYKIYVLLNEFQTAMFSEIDFWCEKYYKLGFYDAIKLKKEIKMIGEDYNGEKG